MYGAVQGGLPRDPYNFIIVDCSNMLKYPVFWIRSPVLLAKSLFSISFHGCSM